jgi:hypothetical protein
VRCKAGDSNPVTKLRETVDDKQQDLKNNVDSDQCTEQLRSVGEEVVNKKREVVDEVTKEDITKDIILRNQDDHPRSPGTFFPRPEIERRPETGEHSFGSLFYFDGAAPETINGRLVSN